MSTMFPQARLAGWLAYRAAGSRLLGLLPGDTGHRVEQQSHLLPGACQQRPYPIVKRYLGPAVRNGRLCFISRL